MEINKTEFILPLMQAIKDIKGKQYLRFNTNRKAIQLLTNKDMKACLLFYKQHNINCCRSNFRNLRINGVQFYYFTLTYDDYELGECIFSYFFLDDDCVKGSAILCRKKENREMIWKYLGSKE